MTLPLVRQETDQGCGLRGYCGRCRKDRYFPPEECIALFGADTPIKHAEKRLVCSCGATGRTIPGITLGLDAHDTYRVCGMKSGWTGGMSR